MPLRLQRMGHPNHHDSSKWHRLSAVDDTTRTATCSQCGPTRFLWKVDGKRGRSRRCYAVIQRHNTRCGPRTSAERAAAIARQEGRCAICGRKAVLVDDHDHATGKARDMLCSLCNVALGAAHDDPAVLRAMADYIDRHSRR